MPFEIQCLCLKYHIFAKAANEMRLFCSNQRNDFFLYIFHFDELKPVWFIRFECFVHFVGVAIKFLIPSRLRFVWLHDDDDEVQRNKLQIYYLFRSLHNGVHCVVVVCLAWYILNLCEINCLKQKKRAYYSMVRYSCVFCCCCCCFGS